MNPIIARKYSDGKWLVDLRAHKQGRHFFKTEGEANEFAASKQNLVNEFGRNAITKLSQEKLAQYISAEIRLEAAGMTIDQAITIALEHRTDVKVMLLGAACDACVQSKVKSGKRASHIRTMTQHFRALRRKFEDDKPCHEIKFTELEVWINENDWADATKKSILTDVETLFGFVLKHGGVKVNPVAAMEKIFVDRKQPRIYTPDECERWMRAVQKVSPQRVKYYSLRLFGGLRGSEAAQLKPEDFRKADIRVESSAAKNRDNRYVQITKQLRAWLKWKPVIQILEEPGDWEFAKLKKEAGFAWKKNALRKSNTSYTYHLYGAKFASNNSGHSESILFSVYRQLVTPADAKKFEAIRP